MKTYYVYILSNKLHTVFYTGMTSNLVKRIGQHKDGDFKGFTKKYNVKKLLYYDTFSNVNDAINAEKKIKKWKREWKVDLIREKNSMFRDLSKDLF